MTDGTEPNAPPAQETEVAPAQKTDAELADKLYDPNLSYGRALRGDYEKMRDVIGMSDKDANDAIAVASQFFSDARVPIPEARTLHGLFVHHLAEPADDETVKQWTIESRTKLRQTYGKDADARLAAVNEFLGRYPTLNNHLNQSGLGSNPRVVMALAEQTRNFRRR